MNKKSLSIAAAVVALLGTGAFVSQNAFAQSVPAPVRTRRNERHPELRMALRALMNAQRDLNKGAHDFDGHRAKAEELVDGAISQVKQAIASDKK